MGTQVPILLYRADNKSGCMYRDDSAVQASSRGLATPTPKKVLVFRLHAMEQRCFWKQRARGRVRERILQMAKN